MEQSYTSISDIVIMAWNFCDTTTYSFNLFNHHWDMTILQIMLLPCIAGISINIVRHILQLME